MHVHLRATTLSAILAGACVPRPASELPWRAPPDSADPAGALAWGLAQIGASPEEPLHADVPLSPVVLALPPSASAAWDDLADDLRTEVSSTGSVDAGRLLAALLADPERYLAATGACDVLPSDHPTGAYAITDSGLVPGPRLVTARSDGSWRVDDGEGALEPGFAAEHTDLLRPLANGWWAVASYDAAGHLVAASPHGGVPGRCLWCHEGDLLDIRAQVPPAGFPPHEAFSRDLDEAQAAAAATRSDLAFDPADRTLHTHTEHLMDRFLEPDAARVAWEWSVSEAEARALLAGVAPHATDTWPGGNEVWWRAEVDRVGGFDALEVPVSSRGFADPSERVVGADCDP